MRRRPDITDRGLLEKSVNRRQALKGMSVLALTGPAIVACSSDPSVTGADAGGVGGANGAGGSTGAGGAGTGGILGRAVARGPAALAARVARPAAVARRARAVRGAA